MSDFPQVGRNVFIANGHPKEYAHFGWGDINSQFYGYIAGYKEVADTIIRHALEKNNSHILDTCVFPACFLYRQYLNSR